MLSRKKLGETLSSLSKAQESVINGIIHICDQYRRNNQEKNVRRSMEETEFIDNTFAEIEERVEDYLEKRKHEESSSASTKSKQRSYLQEEPFQAQQREKKLEEEMNCCEKEYEVITIKLQKEIETKKTTLAATREFLAKNRMTTEEQINKDLDAQSIGSDERTNRVVNYINANDMEDFIRGQDKSKNQEKSEQCKEDIPSNGDNTRRNQPESDL